MLLLTRIWLLPAAVATTTATAASTTATEAAAAGSRPADALEAVAAIYRSVTTRLERDFGGLATVAANHVEQLALDARAAAEAAFAATTAFPLIASQGATGATTLWLAEATR